MSLSLYAKFYQALKARKPDDGFRYMPYGKNPLPGQLFANWMAYSQMYEEFARELANIINKFSNDIERLRAWAEIMSGLSDTDKVEACLIAVDDLATISLNLPYVIRSRFFFAGAHLSHQANRALQREKWVDNLPLDNEIYKEAFDVALLPWKRKGNKLKIALEKIENAAYREATSDFRNAYNHRFSRRFVIGMTNIVTRYPSTNGGYCYSFGGARPFEMDEIADLLVLQRNACYAAFDAFEALIEAHAAAIGSINADQLNTVD